MIRVLMDQEKILEALGMSKEYTLHEALCNLPTLMLFIEEEHIIYFQLHVVERL